ncbi:hypothetical protein ACI2KR_27265 [Pseudomonas luteola]
MNLLEIILKNSIEDQEKRDRITADQLGLSYEQYKDQLLIQAKISEAESKMRDEQLHEERLKKDAKEAEFRAEWGKTIGLGVSGHVGHIIKLGGLTERSDGNGITQGTVYHVVLDEALERGRLFRKEGDLLCRPASTLGRKRSLDISGTLAWGNPLSETWWHDTPITCAACLKVLKRLNRTK